MTGEHTVWHPHFPSMRGSTSHSPEQTRALRQRMHPGDGRRHQLRGGERRNILPKVREGAAEKTLRLSDVKLPTLLPCLFLLLNRPLERLRAEKRPELISQPTGDQISNIPRELVEPRAEGLPNKPKHTTNPLLLFLLRSSLHLLLQEPIPLRLQEPIP